LSPARQLLLAAGVWLAGYTSLMQDAEAQAVSAKDLARCAAIAADPDRLACYDRLARSAPTEARAQAVAQPQAQPPEQSFGMIKPPADKPPEPSRMEAKVLDVTTDSRGAVTAHLDNGQAWTLDDGAVMLRAGDAIVIKRAALGSFLMTTPTNRVYRVRRLR
jgi:hypothetical protein